MTVAETLAPYHATTAPHAPTDHVCPLWATECHSDDGAGLYRHFRLSTRNLTRETEFAREVGREAFDVDLYGQTNTNEGQLSLYIAGHGHTLDEAETLALAVLELVALGRAGSVEAPAQHHDTHPTTEGTTR